MSMHAPVMRGYIAVVSALILASALLALTVVAGTSAYEARRAAQAFVSRVDARHRALSCLYAAAYALGADPEYRVPEGGLLVFLSDTSHACRIDSISAGEGGFLLSASATAEDTVVRLQGIVSFRDSGAPYLESWKEVN